MVAVNRAAFSAVTMKFKDLLRDLRDKAGLTQQELADLANMPVGSLRNHEQGHRLPSFIAAAKLARALGVPLDKLANCDELSTSADPAPIPRKRRKRK